MENGNMENFILEVNDEVWVQSTAEEFSMRNPFEKELAKRQALVDQLTTQLAIAKEVLAALKEIAKKYPQETSSAVAAPIPTKEPKPELRPGTDLAAVRDAILLARKPLHVTELLGALGKENTKEHRVSLTGSLGTYVRKGQIFNRPRPNVFGLIEMEFQDIQESLPIAS